MPYGSGWSGELLMVRVLALCCALGVFGAVAATAAATDSGYKREIVNRLIANHEHAKEYVASRWHELEDDPLPCLRASTVGHVGPKSTYSKGYQSVLQQSDVEALNHRGFPLYNKGCPAWVSHKYKFIYVRMLKSASSTVLYTLTENICTISGQVGVARCKPDELIEVPSNAGSALAADTDKWWKEYFVFSFIRNPWSRLSSAYFMFTSRDLMHRRLADDTPGEICGPELPFADVAKYAGAIGDLCDDSDCCTYSATEGWKRMSAYVHVHDQYHCLFDVDGRVMVDFIGTAEDFEMGFMTVLSEIRRRSGRQVDIPSFRHHNIRKDAATGKRIDPNQRARECSMEHYPHMNKVMLRDIAQQYALTAVHFGYIHGYVPQLQTSSAGTSS